MSDQHEESSQSRRDRRGEGEASLDRKRTLDSDDRSDEAANHQERMRTTAWLSQAPDSARRHDQTLRAPEPPRRLQPSCSPR
jgi:hypothetical protein